jgi:hypothetical protein
VALHTGIHTGGGDFVDPAAEGVGAVCVGVIGVGMVCFPIGEALTDSG